MRPRAGLGDGFVVLPPEHGLQDPEKDYHTSADLTAQPTIWASHPGRHHQTEATHCNGGIQALKFGKTHEKVYTELTTTTIDLCPLQVLKLLRRAGGASSTPGESPRAPPTWPRPSPPPSSTNGRRHAGFISGRKAFQRPMKEGAELLNAIQDVYLDPPSPSLKVPEKFFVNTGGGSKVV